VRNQSEELAVIVGILPPKPKPLEVIIRLQSNPRFAPVGPSCLKPTEEVSYAVGYPVCKGRAGDLDETAWLNIETSGAAVLQSASQRVLLVFRIE
jgi:hypothetical protein